MKKKITQKKIELEEEEKSSIHRGKIHLLKKRQQTRRNFLNKSEKKEAKNFRVCNKKRKSWNSSGVLGMKSLSRPRIKKISFKGSNFTSHPKLTARNEKRRKNQFYFGAFLYPTTKSWDMCAFWPRAFLK
jgi:hypothetical protein